MKLHANARTCPKSRRLMAGRVLDQSWSLRAAAEAAGVSERTARKWVGRFRAEGEAGLVDRSSVPHHVPHRTPAGRVQAVEALRRLRMTSAEIAAALGMALSTVSVILKRIGLGRRSRLTPPEPPNRYERARPGELVHIDVKKLGRIGHRGAGHRALGGRGPGRRSPGAGWEFVHVCVDDATRLAFAEVLPDERTATVLGFLRRALAWLRARGIEAERLMTDNGSAYRSRAHAMACRALGLRHLRTRPYRPQTNGKAERFIQTMLGEWAYGPIWGSSAERTAALEPWLNHYNFSRPHGALSHRPPGRRLEALQGNKVVGNYT
jgi:transposase InsO family protein